MKKIILDTDVGIDCDDAVALGLLLTAQNQDKCQLQAVTVSTTRKGAVGTVKAICNFFGIEVPIGGLRGEPLPCDATQTYATNIAERFKQIDDCSEATKLLRKTIASAQEKITLIAIGPLTNIANLLKSQADEYSVLSGIELVKKSVDKIYMMGGCFVSKSDGELMTEWNIAQDIPSARYVAEYMPCEMIYCPFEVGKLVKTRMKKDETNPVWFSMLSHARYTYGADYTGDFSRESWDPVTCLSALDENNPAFTYSKYGRIAINEQGQTLWTADEHRKHRYVTTESTMQRLENIINESIR